MGAALGSELRALDGGHCRGVVRAQGAGRQLYRRRTASRQAACANSAYIAECALAPGSCRQRTGFALPAPYLGRGAAEGLLERTAERTLALETERFGNLADRSRRVAHQRPGVLQPQPGGVLERCFAEHVAMDADQVPGRIDRKSTRLNSSH